MFQSHAGSIEAWTVFREGRSGSSGFNPTLVRLRRVRAFIAAEEHLLFQSHAGSIEAAWGATRFLWVLEFQSHAGSIEAYGSSSVQSFGDSVSIPRWFD